VRTIAERGKANAAVEESNLKRVINYISVVIITEFATGEHSSYTGRNQRTN